MSSVSRRKAKQAKKLKTWTILNHHSSPADHIQGEAVSANNIKKMEGSLNGTIQDSQKAETQSSSEDKEVAVEVDDSQDGDIVITAEEEAPRSEENKELVESGEVEETQEDVSESVAETFEPDAVKDAVDLEFNKDFESDPDGVKEIDLPPSVSGNEGLRETEMVETTIVKDMTVAEEENNVVSHAVSEKLLGEDKEANEGFGDSSLTLTDVAAEETTETSVPKSDESDKVIPTIVEKSLDEKVEEPLGSLEESSYESAKESFQPSPSVVPQVESNENPTTDPVTQREISSWKSCCGLIEIMRGGNR